MDAVSLISLAGVCGLLFFDQRAALQPERPRPRPRSSGAVACRCPFCHEELEDGTPLRRCVRCGTRHHRGCWDAHGGCSVHGCSRPGRRTPEALPAEEPAPEEPEAPAEAGCAAEEVTPEQVAVPV